MAKIVGIHSGGNIGHVMPYGSSTIKAFTLPCDGSAVSRTTYAALFAIIGTTFGVGDGSTTFNLPNGQGVFLRGAGSQTIGGIVHAATHGATNNDSMQGHFHGLATPTIWADGATGNPPTLVAGGTTAANSGTNPATPTGPVTDGTNGTPRTGTETAPANVVVTHCIVWK